jgi:hypothetical protein
MRILITNTALAARAGSELYVRDLALGLLERGHTPLVYSPLLGEVAQEIRAATIPVVDHLDKIALPPDLIHGHHHLETLTALLHFPSVPAVAFCHGWTPWEETPLRFPRILRYVAVDLTCRDRLLFEHGIPEEQIQVLFNFVDLQRFCPRAPLPPLPQRALVFSNRANEGTYLPVVREACTRVGLKLDVMGFGSKTASAQPEKEIGKYDLVFATGRSALEALAVGSAVVLCNVAGIGPLVTVQELDRLRVLNYGIRALRMPLTPENLIQQISRYDAQDAAEVSRRIRSTAGRDTVVDELLLLYQSVLKEYGCSGTAKIDAEEKAVAVYLRWVAPIVKAATQTRHERNQFATRSTQLQETVTTTQHTLTVREEELRATQQTVQTLQATVAQRDADAQRLQDTATAIRHTLATREEELRAAQQAVQTLQATVAQRDADAQRLQDAATAVQRTLTVREAELRATRQTAQTLQATVVQRDADVQRLQDAATATRHTLAAREAELQKKQERVQALQKTVAGWEFEGRRVATWQQRARTVVVGLDSLRHCRTVRLLRRFSPERDLRDVLAPAFRPLRDESARTMPVTKGFRLQPGINLQRVPFVEYPLSVPQANLCGVRLAPVFDLPVTSGWIGVEIISPSQQSVAQGRIPCVEIDEQVPTTVQFPPLPEIQPGTYWLRAFVQEVNGPVRLLEWRRYRFFGCGSLQTRACCAFVFSS